MFNCYCRDWIYTDRMFVSVMHADLLAHYGPNEQWTDHGQTVERLE